MFIRVILLSIMLSIAGYSQGSFDIEIRTTSYGGNYAPDNASMMWVMQGNTHIKTIKKQAAKYIRHCTNFQDQTGGDIDGLSGASRYNHNGIISATWDLTGQDNQPVTPGKYQVWAEMTENNWEGKSCWLEINVGDASQSYSSWSWENSDDITLVSAEYTSAGPDLTPPTVVGVTAARNSVTVTFSEPVGTASAGNAANYSISYSGGSIAVSSAALQSGDSEVILSTADHSFGVNYTLTVSGVQDQASSPNTIVTDNINYTFQNIQQQVITDNIPFDFRTTGLGSSQDFTFNFPEIPANLLSAQLQIIWEDLDEINEASVQVNGNGPYYSNEAGTGNNVSLTGESNINASDLVQGSNSITITFADNLGGSTSGFAVEGITLVYELSSGGTAVESKQLILKKQLLSVSPNPFSNNTLINMDLPDNFPDGKLAIYNLQGRRVAYHKFKSGTNSFLWNTAGFAAGVYVVQFKAESIFLQKKIFKQ